MSSIIVTTVESWTLSRVSNRGSCFLQIEYRVLETEYSSRVQVVTGSSFGLLIHVFSVNVSVNIGGFMFYVFHVFHSVYIM